MTNKPMLSVERELIEQAMLACFEAGFGITHDALRALLDVSDECRCKRYGKDNPHWPCPIHPKPAAQPQGEVERLRRQFDAYYESASATERRLNAQLAERDALLREVADKCNVGFNMRERLLAALSTRAEPKPRGEVDGNSHAPKHRDGPVAVCRLWNEGGPGERTSVEWVKGPCADGTLLYAVTPAPNQQTEPAGEVVRVSEDQALIGLYDEYSLKVGDLVYAEQPAPVAVVLPDYEAAAKKLAECMDYPWEFMSEQGREHMRDSAKSVIEAAKLNGLKP